MGNAVCTALVLTMVVLGRLAQHRLLHPPQRMGSGVQVLIAGGHLMRF